MLILLFLAALQTGPAARNDPPEYIVGPNDVLAITVFNQPQLSGKFAVEADGTLAFPLVGRVTVGGLSVQAVEAEMRERLADGYVRDPHVSVTMEQYRSQQVFVMGEVRQPGALQFNGSMTLLEALARVGSTTEHAGTQAVIVRSHGSAAAAGPAAPPGPNADTVRVDLGDLQAGALVGNLSLRPGDTVFVPRAATVFVSGHVRTAGEYPIRNGILTVRQAITLAGGVTDRGSTRRIQIIRKVDGKEVTISVDLKDIVQAGDNILVRERFF